jgi:outer membrane lipoprotein-sorting protein
VNVRRAFVLSLVLFAGSCAGKGIRLPEGGGTPFPDHAAAYTQATAACRGVRTLTAQLRLSGRAGSTKLRGRVDAGFAAPDRVRLEGNAPFGRPLFILVARGDDATLLLPRDNRVLRNAAPADIVEALAGVALAPAELRAVVAGCGLGGETSSSGQQFDGGWLSVESGNSTTFLRQVNGTWRLVASRRQGLTVEYGEFTSDRPGSVRVRSSSSAPADITLQLSEVDINVDLHERAFEVDIPEGTAPLTLDELRRSGPLGGDAR